MRKSSRRVLTSLLLCLGPLAGGLSATPAFASGPAMVAEVRAEASSPEARLFADWVAASGDNHGLPFVIVDKVRATIFVFGPDGHLRGGAPVLLGLARGDDTVPGIGQRKLSSIRPEERTTPAGRFVAALGNDLGERDVVWVDYDAAISLHRVITTNAKERRLQRLATASTQDNRISYGCINVPAGFFDEVVRPAFTGTDGIVYVLPEIRSIREVFPGSEIDEHVGALSGGAGRASGR